MPGILPDNGESMAIDLLVNGDSTDRGTNLDLILITNASISETTQAGDLTQPSGGGYAPKVLSDGSWTGAGSSRSYAVQTWTATGTWTGGVMGYAILTKGSTPRILAMELEGGGPYTLNLNDTYDVTPTVTIG